jgi:plastocyanin
MRRRHWATVGLITLLAIGGLSGCGGNGDDDEAGVDIRATELLRFDPDQLRTSLNRETVFVFQNGDDSREHNITIPFIFIDAELTRPVSVDVPSGQTRDVTFTVRERPRDGFLAFYCRFHQAEGMVGRIQLS